MKNCSNVLKWKIKTSKIAKRTIFEAMIFDFRTRYLQWRIAQIHQNSNSNPLKLRKWQIFTVIRFPTSISRKIRKIREFSHRESIIIQGQYSRTGNTRQVLLVLIEQLLPLVHFKRVPPIICNLDPTTLNLGEQPSLKIPSRRMKTKLTPMLIMMTKCCAMIMVKSSAQDAD